MKCIMLLYGSYAKGNYSKDSDFDISDPYVQKILRTGIKIM